MRAVLQFGGLLLACVAAAAASDQKNESGQAARPVVARPALPRNGGGPKMNNPRPRLGPPLSNPASPAARLYRATPEERDRALEKLPPKLQEQIRAQLGRFDGMPKEQQQVLIRRAEAFAALSPGEQSLVRRQMAALGKLPQERRGAIGRALRRLQPLSQDEREKMLGSDEFKTRFSPEEQKMIADLSAVMLPPM
jgi:hypothetical protein